MKKFLFLIVFILPFKSFTADLSLNNAYGATNISSTSAYLTISVVSTGAANPYVFAFWGTNNSSTSFSWQCTNIIGVCTQGAYSTQITDLSDSTLYYYRSYGTNGFETNWSSYSSIFRTIQPSTTPPPVSTETVVTDINGVLKANTNFFRANSNAIIAAVGDAFDDSEIITNLQDRMENAELNISNLDISVNILSNSLMNHTNNINTNILHMTTAEKFIATNTLFFVDGTNTHVRAIGASTVAVDMVVGLEGIKIGTNKWIAITTNDTFSFLYFIDGVWSNAFEVTR